jgi:hypothetical protein
MARKPVRIFINDFDVSIHLSNRGDPANYKPAKTKDDCNNETTVFWDVTSRGLVGSYRNHGVTTRILRSEKLKF